MLSQPVQIAQIILSVLKAKREHAGREEGRGNETAGRPQPRVSRGGGNTPGQDTPAPCWNGREQVQAPVAGPRRVGVGVEGK